MHTIGKSNHLSNEELDTQFDAVLSDFKKENDDNQLFQFLANDEADRRAVLMGNSNNLHSLMVCLLIICVLVFFQGFYMVYTAGYTYKVAATIRKDDIMQGYAKLKAENLKPQDPKVVYLKTKRFFAMAILTMILLFAATSLRILITYNSEKREISIVNAYTQM